MKVLHWPLSLSHQHSLQLFYYTSRFKTAWPITSSPFSLSGRLEVSILALLARWYNVSGWPVSLLANHGSVFAKGPKEVPMQYQCVWAGPLATFAWTRVGWSGYPNLFVWFSAAPHAYTLSIIFWLYLSFLYYLNFFPFSVIHLLHARASFSSHNIYYTFPFPSTVVNHDENIALETRCSSSPCRARQGLQILSLLGRKHFYRGMVHMCTGKTLFA